MTKKKFIACADCQEEYRFKCKFYLNIPAYQIKNPELGCYDNERSTFRKQLKLDLVINNHYLN